MIYLAILLLNALLMVILPFVFANYLAKWWGRPIDWGLFGLGAATFILSQIGHLPFNAWVLNRLAIIPAGNVVLLAIFAGFSAGIFEETARYLTYRFWAKSARDWGQGVMLGIGHGGIEAILLGILAAVNGFVIWQVGQGYSSALVPAEQVALIQSQAETLFAQPPYLLLLGAVERLFALCLHLSLSLMVLKVFTRRNKGWLLLAIGWHGLANALAVWLVSTYGVVATEMALSVVALISVWFIWRWRGEGVVVEPVADGGGERKMPAFSPPKPLDITSEQLDDTKYG